MKNLFGFYICVLSLQALWICEASHLKGQRSTRRKFKNCHPHDDCWDHNKNHYGNRFEITRERMYPTPYQNSTLLRPLLVSLATQKHSPDTTRHIQREYDYIIVGAGAAGCALAARLSELPCADVLLLEAGQKPPLLADIPAIARSFQLTDIDWNYYTEPQKYTAAGLRNRQMPFESGKVLGGSSVLSEMIAIRGDSKNFDEWERLGATGWSWKDVLPYFVRMEDNADWDIANNGFHGVGGPVTIARPRYNSALREGVIEAAQILGYPFRDPNTGDEFGLSDFQGHLRRGQKCSSAKAYLVPSEDRENLDIVTGAFVTKILFNGNTAVGVHVDHKGHFHEVKARKEVIISAGAINTPKLLILSGIGPRETLQYFKIPEVADLPVGLNLQDQPLSFVSFVVNAPIAPFLKKIADPRNIKLYIKKKVGPLASTQGIINNAFLYSNGLDHPDDPPDYQLYFVEASFDALTAMNIIPSVLQQIAGPYANRTVFWCASTLLNPMSRGYVTVRSTKPYDPPVIQPNFFEDPDELKVVVEGLKTCLRIAETPPMKKLGLQPFETVVPGCEKFVSREDDYLECIVRTIILPSRYPAGTAKMGDSSDPTTVVDPKLRVKGVKGLRIVDASVMPKITSGNTLLPTTMIAEKAADIIKHHINC